MARRLPTAVLVLACAGLSTTSARADDAVSPYMLRLDAGVPKVASGATSLVGDATIGYAAPSLAGLFRGSAMRFETYDASSFQKIDRADAALDGRWSSGEPADPTRLEVTVSAAAAQYKTTVAGTGGSSLFHREKSIFVRGSVFVGVAARSGGALSGRVLAGIGLQQESYSVLDTSAAYVFADDRRIGMSFELRAHGAWRVVPDVFSLRVDGFARTFSLTRQTVGVTTAGEVAIASGQFRTIETDARVLATADVARFAGLVPGLFAGFDAISVGSGTASTAVAVPFVGVAVVSADD